MGTRWFSAVNELASLCAQVGNMDVRQVMAASRKAQPKAGGNWLHLPDIV